MPFYEYECQACKFYTEVMQKISDAPLTKCPSCGKRRLKKLVSAPVFRLKGGGWYETDFKSDGQRNLVKDKGGEGAEAAKPAADAGHTCGAGCSHGAAKAEPKAEAKAEPKAESKPAPAATTSA